MYLCDCTLESLLAQYLEEAGDQDVALDPGLGDAPNLTAFNSPHLDRLCQGGNVAEAERDFPPRKRMKKSVGPPPGSGKNWRYVHRALLGFCSLILSHF